MSVHVVIPAFNAAKYLSQAVVSIKRQTFGDWHLVIVDDGSEDETPVIASDFATQDTRISVLRQANQGVATARNNGFRASPLDRAYCLFLDADDELENDALEVLTTLAITRSNAPAVHGGVRRIDLRGELLDTDTLPATRVMLAPTGQAHYVTDERPTTATMLAVENPIISTGGVLIRSGVLRSVEWFDSQTAPNEDWDLWYRMSQLGDIPFSRHPVLRYRIHDHNASKNRKLMRRARRRLRSKWCSAVNATHRTQAKAGVRLSTRRLQDAQLTHLRHSLASGSLSLIVHQLTKLAYTTLRLMYTRFRYC